MPAQGGPNCWESGTLAALPWGDLLGAGDMQQEEGSYSLPPYIPQPIAGVAGVPVGALQQQQHTQKDGSGASRAAPMLGFAGELSALAACCER